jgi:hypothetical protein
LAKGRARALDDSAAPTTPRNFLDICKKATASRRILVRFLGGNGRWHLVLIVRLAGGEPKPERKTNRKWRNCNQIGKREGHIILRGTDEA